MGDFLRTAYQILADIKKPLSAKEIVELACERGLLKTKGKTPWQTMKSKLSTEILSKKTSSVFMRSEAGKFALRAWGAQISEHVADRFTKALFDEDIVVFPATSLSRYVPAIGLNVGSLDTRALLSECVPMKRRQAEEDFSVVQLVSFYIVRFQNKYLTYKRTKRLPESRLHGYYSLGFGGHLNPDDLPPLFSFYEPEQVLAFILRELREELRVHPEPMVSYRGLLYDDSREVSKQHLGIVYDVALHSNEFEIGERGFLMDPKFEDLTEILGRSDDFENWSLLVAKEELLRAKSTFR